MKDIGAIGQEWWLGMQINSWLDTNNAIYFPFIRSSADQESLVPWEEDITILNDVIFNYLERMVNIDKSI